MSEGQRPRYRHAYATPILLQGENSSGIQRKPLIRTTYSLQTSDLPPSAANPRDHPYSIASPGCPPSVVLRIHCTVVLPPSAAAGHHIANIRNTSMQYWAEQIFSFMHTSSCSLIVVQNIEISEHAPCTSINFRSYILSSDPSASPYW